MMVRCCLCRLLRTAPPPGKKPMSAELQEHLQKNSASIDIAEALDFVSSLHGLPVTSAAYDHEFESWISDRCMPAGVVVTDETHPLPANTLPAIPESEVKGLVVQKPAVNPIAVLQHSADFHALAADKQPAANQHPRAGHTQPMWASPHMLLCGPQHPLYPMLPSVWVPFVPHVDASFFLTPYHRGTFYTHYELSSPQLNLGAQHNRGALFPKVDPSPSGRSPFTGTVRIGSVVCYQEMRNLAPGEKELPEHQGVVLACFVYMSKGSARQHFTDAVQKHNKDPADPLNLLLQQARSPVPHVLLLPLQKPHGSGFAEHWAHNKKSAICWPEFQDNASLVAVSTAFVTRIFALHELGELGPASSRAGVAPVMHQEKLADAKLTKQPVNPAAPSRLRDHIMSEAVQDKVAKYLLTAEQALLKQDCTIPTFLREIRSMSGLHFSQDALHTARARINCATPPLLPGLIRMRLHEQEKEPAFQSMVIDNSEVLQLSRSHSSSSSQRSKSTSSVGRTPRYDENEGDEHESDEGEGRVTGEEEEDEQQQPHSSEDEDGEQQQHSGATRQQAASSPSSVTSGMLSERLTRGAAFIAGLKLKEMEMDTSPPPRAQPGKQPAAKTRAPPPKKKKGKGKASAPPATASQKKKAGGKKADSPARAKKEEHGSEQEQEEEEEEQKEKDPDPSTLAAAQTIFLCLSDATKPLSTTPCTEFVLRSIYGGSSEDQLPATIRGPKNWDKANKIYDAWQASVWASLCPETHEGDGESVDPEFFHLLLQCAEQSTGFRRVVDMLSKSDWREHSPVYEPSRPEGQRSMQLWMGTDGKPPGPLGGWTGFELHEKCKGKALSLSKAFMGKLPPNDTDAVKKSTAEADKYIAIAAGLTKDTPASPSAASEPEDAGPAQLSASARKAVSASSSTSSNKRKSAAKNTTPPKRAKKAGSVATAPNRNERMRKREESVASSPPAVAASGAKKSPAPPAVLLSPTVAAPASSDGAARLHDVTDLTRSGGMQGDDDDDDDDDDEEAFEDEETRKLKQDLAKLLAEEERIKLKKQQQEQEQLEQRAKLQAEKQARREEKRKRKVAAVNEQLRLELAAKRQCLNKTAEIPLAPPAHSPHSSQQQQQQQQQQPNRSDASDSPMPMVNLSPSPQEVPLAHSLQQQQQQQQQQLTRPVLSIAQTESGPPMVPLSMLDQTLAMNNQLVARLLNQADTSRSSTAVPPTPPHASNDSARNTPARTKPQPQPMQQVPFAQLYYAAAPPAAAPRSSVMITEMPSGEENVGSTEDVDMTAAAPGSGARKGGGAGSGTRVPGPAVNLNEEQLHRAQSSASTKRSTGTGATRSVPQLAAGGSGSVYFGGLGFPSAAEFAPVQAATPGGLPMMQGGLPMMPAMTQAQFMQMQQQYMAFMAQAQAAQAQAQTQRGGGWPPLQPPSSK
jgi:hypothetical protein